MSIPHGHRSRRAACQSSPICYPKARKVVCRDTQLFCEPGPAEYDLAVHVFASLLLYARTGSCGKSRSSIVWKLREGTRGDRTSIVAMITQGLQLRAQLSRRSYQ